MLLFLCFYIPVHASQADVNKLKSSTEVKRKHLKQTELDVRQSTQKMKDLEINIRYGTK